MAAPVRHVGEYGQLDEDEVLELHRLASAGMSALGELYGPQGYNLGWNLGRVAGAGIVDHVHLHVVPRWTGDTNFMPVLADTKVIPEALAAKICELIENDDLRNRFADSARARYLQCFTQERADECLAAWLSRVVEAGPRRRRK